MTHNHQGEMNGFPLPESSTFLTEENVQYYLKRLKVHDRLNQAIALIEPINLQLC
jgi:hypothetical protein